MNIIIIYNILNINNINIITINIIIIPLQTENTHHSLAMHF
jgi:hypothetical protein